MLFQFRCSKCKQLIKANESFFGKTIRCPKCLTLLAVPDPRQQPIRKSDPLLGKKIAHYDIESLLGEGGMGKVYRARNVRLNRTCALKILPESFAKQDKSRIDRFIREAQSAASVEHANVLPVHFIGNVGDTYFIEMQYVDGGTLEDCLRDVGKLETREAARIALSVASALAAARSKGIIHRDIKPSNVMLMKDRTVKVADFGLAKIATATTSITADGAIMGTPLYMSPEHAEGKRIDVRSDIYSLGVVFYEMLTGKPPFTGDHPVALIYHHANTPLPDIRRIMPDIPPHIEAVVKKMTAKKPENRHQNYTELIADLQTALAPVPAVAAPASKPKARVVLAMLAAAITAALVAFLFIARWQREAGPRRPQAAERTPSVSAREAEIPEPEKMFTFWKFLGPKLPVPEPGGEIQQLPAGVIQDVKYSPDGRYLAVAHSFGVDLWDTRNWDIVCRLDGHTQKVCSISFSADGSMLVTGSYDATAIVWDVSKGKQLCKFMGSSRIHSVAFSPGGDEVALADSDLITLWSPETGEQMRVLSGHTEEIRAVAFSPDGTRVASASEDGTVRIWDAREGTEATALKGHAGYVWSVAFSPDASLIASGSDDGTIAIWDITDGHKKHDLNAHEHEVCSLSFNKDGSLLASGGSSGFTVWNPIKGGAVWRGPRMNSRGVSFSPDGKFVAAGHRFGDWSVKLFDAKTGEEVHKLPHYGTEMASADLSPTEPYVLLSAICGAASDCYRLTDLEGGWILTVFSGSAGHLTGGGWRRPIFTPDGRMIAGFCQQTGPMTGGGIQIRDIQTGTILQVLEKNNDEVACLAVSPDSSRIAYRCSEAAAKIFDLNDSRMIAEIKGHTARIGCLALSHDGKMLATGCNDGAIHLWDVPSGRQMLVLEATSEVSAIAFSSDGTLLASGAGQIVTIWDLISRTKVQTLKAHRFGILSVCFSADGQQLASASRGGALILWNPKTGRHMQVLADHRDAVWSISFSRNGRILASASLDGTIGLWRRGQNR